LESDAFSSGYHWDFPPSAATSSRFAVAARGFPDQATERPFKLARRNKFGHWLLASAQAGDEVFSRLTFEFAGAKSSNGALGRYRRFLPPRFDTTLAQKNFEYFLFVRRQRFGFGQDAI
jgi:hypothetical protein